RFFLLRRRITRLRRRRPRRVRPRTTLFINAERREIVAAARLASLVLPGFLSCHPVSVHDCALLPRRAALSHRVSVFSLVLRLQSWALPSSSASKRSTSARRSAYRTQGLSSSRSR